MKMRTLDGSKKRAGFLFCLPFILGLLLFFIKPVAESLRYAFSALVFTPEGIEIEFVGMRNLKQALFADPVYVRTIAESVGNMLLRVPLILLMSMFIAVILNKPFCGKVFFRAVFFLPVIVMNGVILGILKSDYLSAAIMSGEAGNSLFEGMDSYAVLSALGFSADLIARLVPVAMSIFDLVWSAGVPIVLFLAALQTVPEQLYEAARMEGANGWVTFWKVTLPVIMPMFVMNTVYIIADYFTTSSNPVIEMISSESANMHFEYAAGLSWMYLLAVGFIIAALLYLMNRKTEKLGV